MSHLYPRPHSLCIALCALSLSACGTQADGNKPVPQPKSSMAASEASDAAKTALPEEKSILSSDAAINLDAAPLEPVKLRIPFDDGRTKLGDAAIMALEEALDSRQMKAGGPIILRGHTDSAGNDAANLRASKRRADAVRDWLVTRGVAATRITIFALGEQNPAKPNANPDGSPNDINRAYNRRVTIDIALPADLAAQVTDEAPTLVEQVAGED
ncbi:MAG: OmpA family protein [Pontixanthobacter sp.]